VAGIANKLKRAAPVRNVAIYGGASQEEQQEQLAQPSTLALVVIGTPGRLTAAGPSPRYLTVCSWHGGY